MPRDDLYLKEMVEAADQLAAWLREVTLEQWIDDAMLQSAALHKLTVLGEAARGLSAALKSRHPHVPWRDVVDFRNLAVHEYFAIEWPTVWHIAHEDVPSLRDPVWVVLRSEFPEVAQAYEEQRG